MYYILWCFIIDAFNRICECKRKCDICNVSSKCTKEIGILRATTNNHQASCFRQDNQERPQTHKHTLYSLTRRLYRVGALGSRHTEMWRDKCEILENMLLIFSIYLTVCMCYLQAPCEGRGCRGGCPCGRGVASPGSPSRGMVTVETRRDSENIIIISIIIVSRAPVGDVIASPASLSTSRLALISQELNLNLKWMLEITASKQFNSNKSEYAQIMRNMCGNFKPKCSKPFLILVTRLEI